MKPLVLVSSVIANKPFNGGNAQMVLNWIEGLAKLGAEVGFIEQIQGEHCTDAAGARADLCHSVNRAYFDQVLASSGAATHAALVANAGATLAGATVHGATVAELQDLADDADLLINISGHLAIDSLKTRFRRKAYIDLDPGYTQLWHADGTGARLEGHDVYFSVGQNIGTGDCDIPTNGITWQPLRQPIVLDGPVTPAATTGGRFTTVGSWRGAYAPMTYGHQTFGCKAHEFRRLMDLPRRSPHPFEIALDIHPADRRDLEALRSSGWNVVDAQHVAATPESYRRYIEESSAECSAAQGMYVQTRSGWFSDRTARYLAAGKPVLIQDTGFRTPARTGEGVVVFSTLAEAEQGAERIARDYRAHGEAARFAAERYFDSTTELARLMDGAGAA